jgi:flagellar biosynthesis protein FlhF
MGAIEHPPAQRMNVKRFTARSSRDALQLVRQAFGPDAVVLSTRPSAEGVEVLAMGPEGMQQIEQVSVQARHVRQDETPKAVPARPESPVEQDVEQLAMSTLSFQDYVRERMLKKREADRLADAASAAPPAARSLQAQPAAAQPLPPVSAPQAAFAASAAAASPAPAPAWDPVLARDDGPRHAPVEPISVRRDPELLDELRAMKGLIEERFGALAFMDRLQRSPKQAGITQKLLDCGFSPALIRKLGDGMPADVPDENAWAAGVLERNLCAAESEPALEDVGGVYALVGATGVGKTTSTAKIAAAFAAKHGAAHLGLVTLDAYRVGAQEQLRTYGRILGVPVHTAHDRASLEDLLELLAGKRMVLIDTAGMAQRDSRTGELLDMLSHRSIQKLLVVNAAAQGETIDDVAVAYRAAACRGVVLSKLDEAVKLGGALDTLIRHKLKVVGVANGQRVPEDWHRLSSQALVQRALRASGHSAWRLDPGDVNLVFATARTPVARHAGLHA